MRWFCQGAVSHCRKHAHNRLVCTEVRETAQSCADARSLAAWSEPLVLRAVTSWELEDKNSSKTDHTFPETFIWRSQAGFFVSQILSTTNENEEEVLVLLVLYRGVRALSVLLRTLTNF